MNEPEQVATALHSELRRTVALSDGGERRLVHQLSEPGAAVLLIQGMGLRAAEWADVRAIHGRTNAPATRTNPGDDVVREREGDLAFVVEQLIEFPSTRGPQVPQFVLWRQLPGFGAPEM